MPRLAVAGSYLRCMARNTRAKRTTPSEPLVEGESARLIIDTLRSFPLSVGPTGQVVIHDTATGEARAALDRAYPRAEMTFMIDTANCSCPGEHRTLDQEEFRSIVIRSLAENARKVLGEEQHLDPLWMPWPPGPPPPLPPRVPW